MKAKKTSWEEEFDKRFPSIRVGEFMSKNLWADKNGEHTINVECYQDWPEFYHYTEGYEPITPEHIKAFIRQVRQEAIEEALMDFSEYCHSHYKGCSMENNDWIYSYSAEVVIMAENYLAELKKKEGI